MKYRRFSLYITTSPGFLNTRRIHLQLTIVRRNTTLISRKREKEKKEGEKEEEERKRETDRTQVPIFTLYYKSYFFEVLGFLTFTSYCRKVTNLRSVCLVASSFILFIRNLKVFQIHTVSGLRVNSYRLWVVTIWLVKLWEGYSWYD